MEIVTVGMAGTLESCDAAVVVEPGEGGLALDIQCPDRRFIAQVTQAVKAALAEAGVTSARVSVRDRSALDCTLRARVLAACGRASGEVSR